MSDINLGVELSNLSNDIKQVSKSQNHIAEIMEAKLETIRNEVSFASRSQAQSLEIVRFMIENHIATYDDFRKNDFSAVDRKVSELEGSKNRIYGFALALSILGSTAGATLGKLL